VSQSVALQGAIEPAVGRVGRIPVRNLWLLMLYASDLFRALGEASIALEDKLDEIPELVAEILAQATELRLRRALTTGYRQETAELGRVRGRIDLLATLRKESLQRGRVVCRYEAITADTPRNRLVRAGLAAMARLVADRELRHRCSVMEQTLVASGVQRDGTVRELLAQGRLARHEQQDRIVVAAARLALQLALPTEDAGDHRLFRPDREDAWVRQLFEHAVAGIYEAVLGPKGWQVSPGVRLDWQVGRKTSGMDAPLPSMKTDIILESPDSTRRLVVDTKFTSIVTRGWYREESLKSGYLYQMYAYVRSQVGGGDGRAARAAGLLLHPAIDSEVDESVEIQGHSIRFATVDLAGAPRTIRDRVVALAEPVWPP
jgi:5-methylcytosine-specific restriction enzyme subunit McrC